MLEFEWRYDRRSGNCNLSNCKLIRKRFWDFNVIPTHGAAVLYQLSHEDPDIESRPICRAHLNYWKEWHMKMMWIAEIQI